MRAALGRILRAALVLLSVAAALSLASVAALRWLEPPATFAILRDRLGPHPVFHRPVALSAISPHMVRAVIAAEDAGFCRHRGFDLAAIREALLDMEAGGRLRGASTISQQTAKNIFLWPERSWMRKILEAWFTLLIEALWGKPRIMEMYLNHIEFARGVWGVEAAARHHFGKAAAALGPQEAARLAAVLPQPRARDAARPGPFVRRHARRIEARMNLIRRERLDRCVFEARATAGRG